MTLNHKRENSVVAELVSRIGGNVTHMKLYFIILLRENRALVLTMNIRIFDFWWIIRDRR